jgi:hypothetical protein
VNKFKYVIFPDRNYTFRINGEDVEVSGEELYLVVNQIADKQQKMSMLDIFGISYDIDIDNML